MLVLGISAYFHDSAAALIQGEDVVAAVQEERFSRLRHDSAFPAKAIISCLSQANLSPESIEAIVFYDKPMLKFDRLLETYLNAAPKGFQSFRKAMPVWLREKLFLRDLLVKELRALGFPKGIESKIKFSNHHLSHAASAFYPSPFADAAILTIDGVGEWSTTSIAHGRSNEITTLKEIHFPHSLGLLYSAFTAYCGFTVNSGEYKLMGLAPYGNPVFADLILKELISVEEDGSFALNMAYFNYTTGLTMFNASFETLMGGPARKAEGELTQHYKDVAASIQSVTETVVAKLAKHALEITGSSHLCLAGGVALNCVANGFLRKEKVAEEIWVQPAAGDAGGALGAALAYFYAASKANRIPKLPDGISYAYLGPSFDDAAVKNELDALAAKYQFLDFDEICKKTALGISEGKAAGWFQDRMEFGPRALGNRSILADPRDPHMQRNLNLKIKYRESFRPFAPAVLEDEVQHWFEYTQSDPYMLFTTQVLEEKRNQLPAITHVDGSARVQTVTTEGNAKFYQLVKEFEKITGCPVLINTSFNLRGEPIVQSPADAYRCFMSNELDLLVVGNFLLYKTEQPAENRLEPSLGAD